MGLDISKKHMNYLLTNSAICSTISFEVVPSLFVDVPEKPKA